MSDNVIPLPKVGEIRAKLPQAPDDAAVAAIRERARLSRESWPEGSPRPQPMVDRDTLLAALDYADELMKQASKRCEKESAAGG